MLPTVKSNIKLFKSLNAADRALITGVVFSGAALVFSVFPLGVPSFTLIFAFAGFPPIPPSQLMVVSFH